MWIKAKDRISKKISDDSQWEQGDKRQIGNAQGISGICVGPLL